MKYDLESIMHNSKSLIELERTLKYDHAVKFPNLKPFLAWIGNKWVDHNNHQIIVALNSPPKKKIPTRMVIISNSENSLGEVDNPKRDIRYEIHGVTKDNKPLHKSTAGEPSIEKAVYKFIKKIHSHQKKQLSASDNSDILKEDYLFAPGFNSSFIYPKRKLALISFDSNYNTRSTLAKPLFIIGRALVGLFKDVDEEISLDPVDYSKFWQQDGGTTYSQYVDYVLAHEMKQPLNLEKNHLSEKISLKNRSYKLFKQTTNQEKSYFMAQFLKKHAMDNKLDVLHYFCDIPRVTEIKYFLEHPEFSFEKLEDRVKQYSSNIKNLTS